MTEHGGAVNQERKVSSRRAMVVHELPSCISVRVGSCGKRLASGILQVLWECAARLHKTTQLPTDAASYLHSYCWTRLTLHISLWGIDRETASGAHKGRVCVKQLEWKMWQTIKHTHLTWECLTKHTHTHTAPRHTGYPEVWRWWWVIAAGWEPAGGNVLLCLGLSDPTIRSRHGQRRLTEICVCVSVVLLILLSRVKSNCARYVCHKLSPSSFHTHRNPIMWRWHKANKNIKK